MAHLKEHISYLGELHNTFQSMKENMLCWAILFKLHFFYSSCINKQTPKSVPFHPHFDDNNPLITTHGSIKILHTYFISSSYGFWTQMLSNKAVFRNFFLGGQKEHIKRIEHLRGNLEGNSQKPSSFKKLGSIPLWSGSYLPAILHVDASKTCS